MRFPIPFHVLHVIHTADAQPTKSQQEMKRYIEGAYRRWDTPPHAPSCGPSLPLVFSLSLFNASVSSPTRAEGVGVSMEIVLLYGSDAVVREGAPVLGLHGQCCVGQSMIISAYHEIKRTSSHLMEQSYPPHGQGVRTGKFRHTM